MQATHLRPNHADASGDILLDMLEKGPDLHSLLASFAGPTGFSRPGAQPKTPNARDPERVLRMQARSEPPEALPSMSQGIIDPQGR